MSLWIYLHFPSLQLDALYCEPSQGVIIVEGRRNEIVQLNQEAQANGVKRGMGLATAASLCGNLQVLQYDACCESDKLKEIAHGLYTVTSDISFFEPNGLLLHASNMLTLYDGLENYWRSITDQLDKLPFNYTYSSGYSPFAAKMLAQKGVNQILDSKQELSVKINQCQLSETELTTKQVSQLTRVGVNTVKDLLSISMADIAKRFDSDLVNYTGRLTGEFHHTINFYHPPERFNRYLDLLFDVVNLSFLEKPLLKLLAQLEDFLRVRDQYAHELSLLLQLRNNQSCEVSATSAAGEYRQEIWLKLFQLKFESVRLSDPVVRLSLSVKRVAAKQGDMADLFRGKQGKLSPLELLSLLQAKLGEQNIQGVRITEDPRPHISSQYCQPMVETPDSTTIPIDKNLLRPSILLPFPKPLRERISIIQGPERLSTGWWDGQAIIRDYFIARTENGRWLWVFRTPEQKWFLHGVFS
ncbi:Y-family DNA polymerase [Alkalimarinus coralli]|uniref:Y-family DNA polymerase n=1 Tax=Alkalimarinus coralli TaxID=2935863 RepID=UPI00202ACFB2|nr:DNA polymerase Y family protein [Alkalimarinus coralli]